MDRKEEETEHLNEFATFVTTTTPKTKTEKFIRNILTSPNDIDTSTESSDTLESWTLVNEKEKDKIFDNFELDNENRLEVLQHSDNEEETPNEDENKIKPETQLYGSNDLNNDDLSDGVSIISESESVGRISPHPYVMDHLHDMNMQISLRDHMADSIANKIGDEIAYDVVHLRAQQTANQHLRQRRRSIAAVDGPEKLALQKATETVGVEFALVRYVKRGLQGIFYVGVCLAILGLIGKIVNPTWQPLTNVINSSPSNELQQKINDMELQNNLMRAEIDLLNKQVKYLSSLNDPQQQKSNKFKGHKESKTFKAWSGNGDSLKPVDITKHDLKKPYKCPDGSFVEIANMCMEQRAANEPSLVDQFGQVMENLKAQSEAFKTFEEVAEELQGYEHNPFEQLQDTKEYAKNKPIFETSEDNQNSQQQEYISSPHKYHKHNSAGDKPGEYSSSTNTRKEYANTGNSSEEKNNWKTNKYDNNSKERKYHKDNSRERYTKDFNDSKENWSQERSNKQRQKYDKSNEDDDDRSGEWLQKYKKIREQKRQKNVFDDSGEWHEKYMKHREEQRKRNDIEDGSGAWQEKYMKHREQQRKRNDQKYQSNKNWYIKRGDSRENKRSGEKLYR